MGIENPVHLLFIGLVALLVLGPKRLPDLARAAGRGVKELREAMSGEAREQSDRPASGDSRRESLREPPHGSLREPPREP